MLPHLVPESAAGGRRLQLNEILPLMLVRYCGPGLLGLGITALIAGFMSGMAGNVTPFPPSGPTTFTGADPDKRPPTSTMCRWALVDILGVIVSIGAAYLVMQFASIMDYVQALFSFFIASLFGTVILGMLWKRATSAGGFWGLLTGTVVSVGCISGRISTRRHWAKWRSPCQGHGGKYLPGGVGMDGVCPRDRSGQLCTKAKPESELKGLVYGATVIPHREPMVLYKNHWFWAG